MKERNQIKSVLQMYLELSLGVRKRGEDVMIWKSFFSNLNGDTSRFKKLMKEPFEGHCEKWLYTLRSF